MENEEVVVNNEIKADKRKNDIKNILSWVGTVLLAFVVALLINSYVFRTSMIYGSSMHPTLEGGEMVMLSKLPYLFSEPKYKDVVVLDSESVYLRCDKCNMQTPVVKAGERCERYDQQGRFCGDVFDKADQYKDPNFFDHMGLSLKYNVITQKLFKVNDHSERFWVKRIIGVAGDTIEFKGNEFYLNGEKIEEDYVNKEIDPAYNNVYHNFYVDSSVTVPEGYVFVMGDNRGASQDSRLVGVVPVSAIIGKVISGV